MSLFIKKHKNEKLFGKPSVEGKNNAGNSRFKSLYH